MTNQAPAPPPLTDGFIFISHGILSYTGRDVDHNKVIFCEAVNIEGRQKIKYTEMSLNILCKFTSLLILWLSIMITMFLIQ